MKLPRMSCTVLCSLPSLSLLNFLLKPVVCTCYDVESLAARTFTDTRSF